MSTSSSSLAELADAVTQVPLVDGTTTRFVNFDYAASAPPLASVHRVVTTAMAHYASIHRGQSYLSRLSTAAYERARETIAELTGARPDDVVVFTRNTTDALNLLASAVPGRVVHLDIEHHANLLPWRGGRVDRRDGRGQLSMRPCWSSTRELQREPAALVSVTGASNVTGECLPLAALSDLAHRHGARLAVDGAQLAPHRPVDLAAAGIDYFACSGHKLYAPYGAGALIGRRDWLDAAEPHQRGGGAVVSVSLDGVEWKPSPARHEGGTPNLVGAVSLGAAFQALDELGFDAIIEHEQGLHTRLLDGLGAARDRARCAFGPITPTSSASSASTFPGYRADLVAAYLSAEHGIGVRGGKFCAHPLLQRFGLGETGAVRASIGLGTSSHDVDAILQAIENLIANGPSWDYVAHDGYLSPNPDPRPSIDEVFPLYSDR